MHHCFTVLCASLPFIKVVTGERVWNFAPDEPEQMDYWFDAFEFALQPYM